MLITRGLSRLLSLLVLLCSSVGEAATPQVLIFGGGWGPDGTQASIEAHVEALAEVLKTANPEVLFAGPDARARSVQVSSKTEDEVGNLLGLVFGEAAGIGVEYRAQRVTAGGPATEAALLEAITKRADRPEGLIVFGVGHGQLVGEVDRQQSALALWGSREALSLGRLAEALSAQRWRGPLALVLGQCHSGGFINLAFGQARRGPRLAQPARCVLAAVPEDRPASGCTSDVDDASARAFIALVAEAFARPEAADFDRDQAVSLSEAFTYARVHDQTVNVPVRSSEAYLRYAGTRPKRFPVRRALLAMANPEERAVLESLVPKFEVAEVRGQFERLIDERNRRSEQLEALLGSSDDARAKLQELLFERWPELTSRLHAVSRRLLSEDAKELRAFLLGRPELAALEQARRAEAEQELELERIERETARLERWLRAADNVMYERELNKNPTHKRRLAALKACEAQSPLRRPRP